VGLLGLAGDPHGSTQDLGEGREEKEEGGRRRRKEEGGRRRREGCWGGGEKRLF